ncbi:MAG: hypothetical protein JSS37_10920 [Proteobacteria bacterium]|nr:hypothetical protein [Pseudomonadota bacterium]
MNKKITQGLIIFSLLNPSIPSWAGDVEISESALLWKGSLPRSVLNSHGDFFVSGDQRDFYDDNNWVNIILSPSTAHNVVVFFGVFERYLDGIFLGYTGSSETAVLSSDYNSTGSLFMSTGIDTGLNIVNSTYTLQNATIGARTNTGYPNSGGVATVTLNNGHISGDVFLGSDSFGVINSIGNSSITGHLTMAQSTNSYGILNIAAASNFTLTGALTFGSGNAEINNQGNFHISQSINNNSSNVTWMNHSGGALYLDGGSSFGGVGAGNYSIVNESTATIYKLGIETSTISWDVVNNGTIDVANDSQLWLYSGFSGTGIANLHDSGFLGLNAALTADSSLTVNGGLLSLHYLRGNHALRLSGSFIVDDNINTYVHYLDAAIENTGKAVLKDSVANFGENARWHNLPGSSVELTDNSGFGLAYFESTPLLINDSGATLSKTGSGTSAILWDVVNNGTIDVHEGQLDVGANLTGTGKVNIDSHATLQASGEEFQAHDLNIEPDGTFIFSGSRLEVVNFTGDFFHDTGIYAPGASPAVSLLNGNYTMTSDAQFEVEIGGTEVGAFDQLVVLGDVNLLHGSLLVSMWDNFTLSAGQVFNFMQIDGNLIGHFVGLNEGGRVGNFGQDLFITYKAGDGNDIALYTSPVPNPAMIWLFSFGLITLALFRRRNKHLS